MNKEVKTNTYCCDNVLNKKRNVKIKTVCCNQIYDGKNLINVNDLKSDGFEIESELEIDGVSYKITNFQSVESFGKTMIINCLNENDFKNEIMKKYDPMKVPDKYYILWTMLSEPRRTTRFRLQLMPFNQLLEIYSGVYEEDIHLIISDLIGINNNLNVNVYLKYITMKYYGDVIYNYPSNYLGLNNLELNNFVYTEFGLIDSTHIKVYTDEIERLTNAASLIEAERDSLRQENKLNKPMLTINGFDMHASVSDSESSYYFDYTLSFPLEMTLTPLTTDDSIILGTPSTEVSRSVLLLCQDTASTQKFICYANKREIISQKLKEIIESGKTLYLLYFHDIPYDIDGSYCDTVIFTQFSYSYKLNKSVTIHRQGKTVVSTEDDPGLDVL